MAFSTKHLLHLRPTQELILVRLLVSLGQAVSVVGLSLFFIERGLTDSQVGLFTGFASLFTAAALLFTPPFLEKFNQFKLLVLSILFSGISMSLLGYTNFLVAAMLVFLVIQLTTVIYDNVKSIVFKDLSRTKEEFSKDTGLSGSLGNLGWTVGPLLGGLMLDYAGLEALFVLAGFFIMLAAMYLYVSPFSALHKARKKLDSSVPKNLAFYISKPMLRIAYLQKMGITIWWSFIWIFMPIFMTREGYSVAAIGFFIALTQLPLFILEFRTVQTVERAGYKKIFSRSYALLMVVCVAAFFVRDFDVVLLLMLFGSLALSFLEPISELFFYELVSTKEEEKAYPIYETAIMTGNIISRVSIGICLILLPDHWTFILVALMTGYIAFRSLSIRKIS